MRGILVSLVQRKNLSKGATDDRETYMRYIPENVKVKFCVGDRLLMRYKNDNYNAIRMTGEFRVENAGWAVRALGLSEIHRIVGTYSYDEVIWGDDDTAIHDQN